MQFYLAVTYVYDDDNTRGIWSLPAVRAENLQWLINVYLWLLNSIWQGVRLNSTFIRVPRVINNRIV